MLGARRRLPAGSGGQADARGDGDDGPARQRIGRAITAASPPRPAPVRFGEQDGELVSAAPGHGAGYGLGEAGSDGGPDVVSGTVAVGIVDRLGGVEVDDRDRKYSPGSSGSPTLAARSLTR
jgi:hypothetical protein